MKSRALRILTKSEFRVVSVSILSSKQSVRLLNHAACRLSAVTQTDPPWVEMEGFKLTHPEGGQKLHIFRVARKIGGFYGHQTHGARTRSNQEFNRAGLGDSPDRPATQGQPQYGSPLRADFGAARTAGAETSREKPVFRFFWHTSRSRVI